MHLDTSTSNFVYNVSTVVNKDLYTKVWDDCGFSVGTNWGLRYTISAKGKLVDGYAGCDKCGNIVFSLTGSRIPGKRNDPKLDVVILCQLAKLTMMVARHLLVVVVEKVES